MTGDAPSNVVLSDKYSLGTVVGSGGMGRVHEARRLEDDAKVAIKVLHQWNEDNSQSVARFYREAKLASALGHENICEVVDHGVGIDGTPFMVMPLLEGESLGDMLKKGAVPVERVVEIIVQTLCGLEAAHVEQIVHRDLKPDNVYVIADGDRDLVKILDFGISKYLGDEFNEVLTRTGTIPGTPAYMAPEQAMGSKSLDARVDIYATGVVLYEALTGKRPFEGDSYNEILFNIVSKPFDAPRAINQEIPAAIERVILRAMDRNPQRRFPSAVEMSRALQDAMDGSDSIGDLPTVTQDALDEEQIKAAMRIAGGRRKRVALLASLALVVAAGIFGLLTVFGTNATEPLESSSPPVVEDEISPPDLVISEVSDSQVPRSDTAVPADEADGGPDSEAIEPTGKDGKKRPRVIKRERDTGKNTTGDDSETETDEPSADPPEGPFGTIFHPEYGDDNEASPKPDQE